MDLKHALKVNAYPLRYAESEVIKARNYILEHARKIEASTGPVFCPLCGEGFQAPNQHKHDALKWKDPFGAGRAA